jgi:hypothetical protein
MSSFAAVGRIKHNVCLAGPMLCIILVLAAFGTTAPAQAGWVIKETPNPQLAKGAGLAGISCTSISFCQATGSYEREGKVQTLAERWDSLSWVIQATPEIPEQPGKASLSGVACTTTTFCEATGTYRPTTLWKGLTEGWNGASWSFKSSPNHTQGGSTATELARVSCAATTACESVGWSANSLGENQPLAEGWNGTEWKLQNVLETQVSGALHGVSCTSVTSCEAVGNLGNSSTVSFARHWNGTTWAFQSAPNPEGAKSAQLDAVSCASSSACEATGFYENGSGVDVPFAERWDGTAWKIQSMPAPGGAKLTMLDDVSCPTTESCRAAGHYQNSAGVNVSLVEAWNGTTWAVEPTPNPEGAKESLLHGISCWSATACSTAGEYVNSSGVKVTLAEKL